MQAILSAFEEWRVPRFFFNVYDDVDRYDLVGSVLPDLSAVRPEAIRAAGEMLRDAGDTLRGDDWRMEVADEHAQIVLTLRFTATEVVGG